MYPSRVTCVALSSYNGAVVDEEQVLWVSGSDGYGVAAGGGDTACFVPLLGDVTTVALASSIAGALDRDSRLWLWGANYDGLLSPDGPAELRPTRLPLRFLELYGGSDNVIGARNDEGLWIVGGGRGRKGPARKLWDGAFTAVAFGREHVSLIDAVGQLWTRGHNQRGQCGQGGPYLPAWRRQPMEGLIAVVAGDNTTWVQDDDGTWWKTGSRSEPRRPFVRQQAFDGADIVAAGDQLTIARRGMALVAAGCGDGPSTLLPLTPPPHRSATAVCGSHLLAAGAEGLLVGGQNTYCQLGVAGAVWPYWRFGHDSCHNETVVALRSVNTEAALEELDAIATMVLA